MLKKYQILVIEKEEHPVDYIHNLVRYNHKLYNSMEEAEEELKQNLESSFDERVFTILPVYTKL